MKRLLTLLLSAVLLLACASAAADSPAAREFDDFTLKTQSALEYAGPKAEGQPLFAYYRTVTGEISTSAVNAVWLSSQNPVSAGDFTAMLRNAEPVMRAQQEAQGNTVKNFKVTEAAEQELWGKAVLVCDTEMTVWFANSNISVIQRSICVTGGFGTYIFSISAFSWKSLEEATDELVEAVRWKK